jgi:hypothetical protein
VEAELSKFLKRDPSALAELAHLLEHAGVSSTTMTANVVGKENIVGQASGSSSVLINKNSGPSRRPKAP